MEVPIGLVMRLRDKKLKEEFNGLLQNTWAKVDFKRIYNNIKQALINIFHIQEGSLVEPRPSHKDYEKNWIILPYITHLVIIGVTNQILL